MSPREVMTSFVLLVLLVTWVYSKNLPSYVKVCKRSSPTLGTCLKEATAAVRGHIAQGIPELNIPSVEPLTITSLKIEQGTQAVKFMADFHNMMIYGLSDYTFTDIKATEKEIIGKIDLPSLYVESQYELNGRVLILPIRGKGLFRANFTNTKADITLYTGLEMHKGKEYYKSENTEVKLRVDKVKVDFGNLFDGDRLVSMATNMFINMNSADIVEEVKPAVEKVVEMFVGNIAKNVFRSLPSDKLFPK